MFVVFRGFSWFFAVLNYVLNKKKYPTNEQIADSIRGLRSRPPVQISEYVPSGKSRPLATVAKYFSAKL